MRHYFKVEKYEEAQDYHICRDSEENLHRINLMVNGDFPGIEPEALVGENISVSYTYPFIEIGMDCKIESITSSG